MRDLGIKDKIKFKPLDIARLIISFDRLTRFKYTEDKYLRVYKDIIINNLISPKLKKSEIDNLTSEELVELVTNIINSSLPDIRTDYAVNKRIAEYEITTFKLNSDTKTLLNNSINYDALISILPEDIPNNLKWLKLLSLPDYSADLSYAKGYHYPVKKLIICEGITEEILLPEFARLLGYDFDKNGIQLISAGGKNQVVKLFYKYAEILNIPIFVLLDSDAQKNKDEIEPKLRSNDKIYILEQGEFEDILPVSLIEKALKSSIENISEAPDEHFDKSEGAVHSLEEFYRTRGAHEFKKAEFAHVVKENITGIDDVSDEFRAIINSIINL